MNNIVASLLPLISTFASLLIYPWCYPINESLGSYVRKNGTLKTLSMQPGLVSFPFILCVVLPLSNQTLRCDWVRVAMGMLFVDTAEYWRHRFEHSNFRVYKLAHKEHHQQKPMTTVEGFRNMEADLLIPLIPYTLYILIAQITFLESMVLTSLSLAATYADHTLTGDTDYDREKFHHVHHTNGWNKNFQQPFFSYWDDLCGTKASWSRSKGWCPFIP